MIIEELLEDPELAELEKCDTLAPIYLVEGIDLHICFQRLPSLFYLSGVHAPLARWEEEGGWTLPH